VLSHRAHTDIVQLCRETPDFNYRARLTCDFLTFQTLVRKLQNLSSAIGANLLKFYARYWWVEATSEWQLVKHPAS